MTLKKLLIAVSLAVTPALLLAQGQGLDPASAEALSATLRMLADPVSRGEAILGTPGAAEIDRQVQSLVGSSQLAQEMYEIAAAVFADLARSSGGDAARMSAAPKILSRAQKSFGSLGIAQKMNRSNMIRFESYRSSAPKLVRTTPGCSTVAVTPLPSRRRASS